MFQSAVSTLNSWNNEFSYAAFYTCVRFLSTFQELNFPVNLSKFICCNYVLSQLCFIPVWSGILAVRGLPQGWFYQIKELLEVEKNMTALD